MIITSKLKENIVQSKCNWS